MGYTGLAVQFMNKPPTHVEEGKPRGRRRSAEAEAAILKATLYLLERQPLRKVTADAIARRAGVSKATIYKWWPNKSQVALDAYLAGMSEQVHAGYRLGGARFHATIEVGDGVLYKPAGTPVLPVPRGGTDGSGFSTLCFASDFSQCGGMPRASCGGAAWTAAKFARGSKRNCARPDLWADDFSPACRPRIAQRTRVGGRGGSGFRWSSKARISALPQTQRASEQPTQGTDASDSWLNTVTRRSATSDSSCGNTVRRVQKAGRRQIKG